MIYYSRLKNHDRVAGDAIKSPASRPPARRKNMDASLEKLKNRIERLTAQQHRIEERYIGSIAKLVADTTQKGFDMRVLTGIILNANDIVTELPAKTEAWQIAGQKFLLRSKNKDSRSKGPQKKAGSSKT